MINKEESLKADRNQPWPPRGSGNFISSSKLVTLIMLNKSNPNKN